MKPLSILITAFVLIASPFPIFAQDCKMDCIANIVVSATKGTEGAFVNFPSTLSKGECIEFTYTPASGSFFRLGAHSIIATSASGQKCSFTIVVTDNEPPVLSEIYLSRSNLWPANNKMKKVKLSIILLIMAGK